MSPRIADQPVENAAQTLRAMAGNNTVMQIVNQVDKFAVIVIEYFDTDTHLRGPSEKSLKQHSLLPVAFLCSRARRSIVLSEMDEP
jgi:hypothetical protein